MRKQSTKIIDLFNPRLEKAMGEWSKFLPEDRIVVGKDLARYDNCTSQAKRKISAALYPVSQDEVSQIVECANSYQISLYPISSGKNWGYGGGNPFSDHCVILDLSKMNRILDFSEELGVITIEPGVTQGQIASFLKENNYPYMLSTIVTGPNCSYLGNALERGFGMIPPRERFLSMTSLKAIMPDGSLYQSLVSDAGGDLTDKVYKWGVGPYLDGLFSQGSFGVVTQASFTLARIPEEITRFYFTPKSNVPVNDLIDRFRKAKQTLGECLNTFEFGNRTQSIYENKNDHQDWMVYGAFHTTKRVSRAVKADLKSILGDVFEDFVFLNETTLKKVKKFPYFYKRSKNWRYILSNIDKVIAYHDLYKGVPNEMHLEYAFAGSLALDKKKPIEAQIKKAGYISFRPVVPLVGRHFSEYLTLLKQLSSSEELDIRLNVSIPSETHIVATTDIFFDPLTQTDQAHNFHKTLFMACKERGYLPSRMHIDSVEWYMNEQSHHYFDMLGKLKTAFDPNNIISPGRIPNS